MAVAQPISRNIIDPTLPEQPLPISPNLMQNVVTWVRDPRASILMKISVAALYAFAALAAGAFFGKGLLALSITTTVTAIWGAREYSLQNQNESYHLNVDIRNLQQHLAFSKIQDIFFGEYVFSAFPVLETANFQVNEEGAIHIQGELDQSVYRGQDANNRPFVVMKIQDLDGGEKYLVIHQKFIGGSEWTSTISEGEPFLNERLGDDDLLQLRQIYRGGHPTYSNPIHIPQNEE